MKLSISENGNNENAFVLSWPTCQDTHLAVPYLHASVGCKSHVGSPIALKWTTRTRPSIATSRRRRSSAVAWTAVWGRTTIARLVGSIPHVRSTITLKWAIATSTGRRTGAVGWTTVATSRRRRFGAVTWTARWGRTAIGRLVCRIPHVWCTVVLQWAIRTWTRNTSTKRWWRATRWIPWGHWAGMGWLVYSIPHV